MSCEDKAELWDYWSEGTIVKPELLSAIICNKSTLIPHDFVMPHLHDFAKTLRDKESRESITERPLLDAFFKNKISEEEFYELLKVHLSIPENENYFRHDLLFFNNENSDFVSKVELLVSRLQKEKLSLLINSRELYTEKSLKQRI